MVSFRTVLMVLAIGAVGLALEARVVSLERPPGLDGPVVLMKVAPVEKGDLAAARVALANGQCREAAVLAVAHIRGVNVLRGREAAVFVKRWRMWRLPREL